MRRALRAREGALRAQLGRATRGPLIVLELMKAVTGTRYTGSTHPRRTRTGARRFFYAWRVSPAVRGGPAAGGAGGR